MSSLRQVHSHEGIARLQQRHLHSHIGLRTGVGLNIGPGASEQALRPVPGKILDLIHDPAATVIAASRKALRIFVGQWAPHCRHHRVRHPVLRCNQFDMAVLPRCFRFDRGCNFRILSAHLFN